MGELRHSPSRRIGAGLVAGMLAASIAPAALVVVSLAPAAVVASERQKPEERKKKKVTIITDRVVADRLGKAQEALGNSKYDQALDYADDLLERKGLSDYERAITYQTLAYAYTGKEQLPKAIDAFEKTLALDALPDSLQLQLQFNLGQLYLMVEQPKKAVAILLDWLSKAENPTPQAHYMVAMALMQTENWNAALEHGLKAVRGTERPQEPWLALLLSVYYNLKRTRDMAGVLEQLVARFPKKTYWLQLSAVYNEIGQDKKSLAALELAYEQGYLTSKSEVTSLAQLYAFNDVPVKAARVVEKGLADGVLERDLKTMELLATAYMRAREYGKAIAPLNEAARLSEKGDLFIQLAQVHMEREEWKEAAAALKKALEKPELTDPGMAWVLSGIVQYNMNRRDLARNAFEKALTFEKSKKSAKQWLDLLKKEGQAAAALL